MLLKAVRGVFGLIAVLAVFNSLTRHDYNLPIFAFLFWAFPQIEKDRKFRQYSYIFAFIILTILADVLFMLTWFPKWKSATWRESYGDDVENLYTKNIWLTVVITILKIGITLALFAPEILGCCFWKKDVDVYEEYDVIQYHKLPPVMTKRH